MNELPPINPQQTETTPARPWVQALLGWVFSVKFWGYGLFWSWNLIFLAFLLLGFAPNLLVEMIQAFLHGLIPPLYLICGALLTMVPVLAVLLGATLLRRSPAKLLALGYGVEGPLMVLLMARIYLVRQAMPAVVMLYAVAILGVLTLLWQLFDHRINERKWLFDIIRVVGLTLLFWVGAYAALLVGFYAIPLASQIPEMFREIWREAWYAITHLEWQTLSMLPFVLLGALLLLYTATLLVVAPIVVPTLYVVHWARGMKAVALRRGRALTGLLAFGVAFLTLALFVVANQQPQHKAFQLLQQPPASLEDAQSLLTQKDTIRQGLLNAYLAPVRYISAVGEVGHIRELWSYAFKLPAEAAQAVEKLYEVVAHPMLYEPMEAGTITQTRNQGQWALQTEPQKAASLYENFFDQAITDGERKIIVNAVRDTWSGDQALTAWQAVDDREILLTQQEVNIVEHGDWAEVELFEAYQNQTNQRQEVVYYFNLPETAVLTGIWLGNSPDRNERSVFHVAPRGAAQQVYREQLRVNMDPALLEQLGPRQYRLRVFPIEAQRWVWNQDTRLSTITEGEQVYFWMTYSVLADGDVWPMPQLAEKANIYWDVASRRMINGVAVNGSVEDWLPASVPAKGPIAPVAHQITFSTGETVLIRPFDASEVPPIPGGLRMAVVLDRSYSMVSQEWAVANALAQIRNLGADVDVYMTASTYRGEQASVAKLADVVPDNIIYFGGQNAAELLTQFFALSKGRQYDALLVLTDGVGFKLGGEAIELPVPQAPVWMVHLGGELPFGYDDATLQAIQASGGGVAGNLEDALTRLAISLDNADLPAGAMRDVVDGYEWLTLPKDSQVPVAADVIVHTSDDSFAALAARRLILSEMYRNRGHIDRVETLDVLHALAVEQGIVTPYSSMIVLVTEQQENRLQQLEGMDNRFEREAEGVGETIPDAFQVTGVPEPHEWLLLGLGAILLAWLAWRKRIALV